MPVDRPTFSESWYRVAELRPRLRSTVQTHRQHFRGQTWHVVQDPSSNQFFRLNDEAYRFVALLDGRRTIAEVWKICNEQGGDGAPTQGEAIQLLGQLYTSNLLAGDLPPDAESLLNRYRQRITREVQGYLSNLLFIRIPVYDPDRFLDRTLGLVGWLFSGWGALLWFVLVGTGLFFIAGRVGDLVKESPGILDPTGIPLLYASFVLIKIFHEFGHAYSCKKFGSESGSGGEVHVMGVMFLVFTPLPYVDASSAWALRKKWHRAIVGAAGMIVEMALAGIAAVVWAYTGSGTTAHVIAYNVMFVGSVSTILFNANPLLRYDGYYIMSDLIEIPNMAQRSKDYLYYLVKCYVWGVRNPRNPSHTPGECVWLFLYAICSTVYRVFICVAILLFITSKLPILGALLAVTAVVAWVVVPLGKFVHYLASNTELSRVRGRAVLTSVLVPGVIIAALGLIPAPDPFYVQGVVDAIQIANVYAETDGFLADHLLSGEQATPGGPPLVRQVNPDLESEARQWECQRRELLARRSLAATKEVAAVQIVDEQIRAVDEKLDRTKKQLADLQVHAPFAGVWLAPDINRKRGAYLHRGTEVGKIATLGNVIVRAVANQEAAAWLRAEADPRVEIRVDGRASETYAGTIKQFLPAGQETLPSPALGYAGGGTMAISLHDTKGTRAAERFFEIQVTPDAATAAALLAGHRVVLRFEAARKPYLEQAWRWALQLFQRRFKV